MDLLIKGLIGGSVTIVITLLASTRVYFLAALIPLFPLFTLIAHVSVGSHDLFKLKEIALFGIFSLIPYFFYLLNVYMLSTRVPLYMNLIISVLVWVILATTLSILWVKLR